MITEVYTVDCMRRGQYGGTEAVLEGSPMRMTIGPAVSAIDGRITIVGPAAEELKLGDRIKVTLEKVVEIPVGLRPYNPQVYGDFIITDENDGRWRFYLGSRQVGWADSLERCKGLIDAHAEKTA